MPTFLFKKWFWIVIAVVAGIALLWYSAHFFYGAGGTKANLTQATAQIKQSKKTKGDYAKIDNSTPYGADNDVAFKWLLQFTRSGQ